MDNCFTGRRDRSRQTSEKDVLYIISAGPARRVHSPGGASFFLSRHCDVIASFSFGAWRVKTSNKPGRVVAKPQHSPRSRPRVSSLINDNHCVNSVTGQKNSVHVTDQGDLNPAPVVAENSKVTLNLNVDSHVANAHIVTGFPQRKGVNPTFCQMYTEILSTMPHMLL